MLRTAIEDCSYRNLIVRSPASRDAATLQPFLDVPGDELFASGGREYSSK